MKRSHRENEVGPWAAEKLNALESYLKYYATALSKQNFRRIYIDAFAGSPVNKVRGSDEAPEPTPFFGDADAQFAQQQFILGSPLRALRIKPPFHEHYFFDLDASRAETLGRVAETYGHDQVQVKVGDCNPLIRSLTKRLKNPGIRGVAFLDPYGAHLEWATLSALAETGTMEVIINFPAAMAINRLITKSGLIPEKWSDQLNACFGTTEWYNVSYSTTRNLFGDDMTAKNRNVAELLLELYLGRLRSIFRYIATPRLVRNTANAPLYYLIWAGPNKLGLTGAEYILRQGEKIAHG